MVNKLTTVLFAPEIEPCIAFWVERLSFTKTTEVPEGGKLGFAIIKKGNVEVMYQSFASGEKDVPALAALQKQGPSFLFVEVEDLDQIVAAMQGVKAAVERRTTFYGSKEFGVFDPAGHVILFAQFA